MPQAAASAAATAATVHRRRRHTTEGEKDRGAQGTNHESIPAVCSSRGRPEKRIDVEQSFKHLQWQPAVAGDDSGSKKPV